jgi:hypothetical protein
MSRKKIHAEPLPEVGDRKSIWSLSRDIRLGWSQADHKGKLLEGWCETTRTRQLWQIVDNGLENDALVKFVGFIEENCHTFSKG